MQEEHLKNHSNLAEAFFNQANSDPDRIVYFQAIVDSTDAPNKLRSKRAATYKEVKQTIINVSFFLQQLGVKKGDKVAIISQSRPEWMEADIAALSIGAVVVSVYQSLPWDDIGYILYDSGAKVVFAENQEQVNKLIKLTNEECEIPETEERDATRVKLNFDKIISFESVVQNDLVVEWKSISSINQGSPKLEVDNLKQNDLAALVYTSGTTGPPKGVMQTHGNHLANVRQVITARIVSVDTKIMLFLPLAHSFAKLMGYLGFITPVQLCFPAIVSTENSKIEPESATKDIREANANAVPLVPRLLEKMQSGILQKANSGGLAGFLLNQTINSAKEVYEARSKDCDASIINQVIYALTGFLRKKICRQLFGSEFQYCISGGAKLGIDTAKFFDSLGIQILEGYGLTETCVATNVNRPGRNKVGTVGPLVGDDIDIEIAMDGEILFRGPNVAIGYYGREKASKEAWDENGWFHTGDLGKIDDQGNLSIVGRKKEIIVSSYGKNLAPEPIEQLIKKSPLVSQSVLVGDGKAFCTAIITLDAAAVTRYGERPYENTEVKKLINEHLEKINLELPNHEKVRGFTIVPGDFTVENGLLTPTFKVKRKTVLSKYSKEIECLYFEK